MFIECIYPAPILNTFDFQSIFGGSDKATLKKDEKGHIRALEFIALKQMTFKVIKTFSHKSFFIYQIQTPFYPKSEIFIDSRFVKIIPYLNYFKPPPILCKKAILSNMKKMVEAPYVWGGNFYMGIDKMIEFYPAQTTNQTVLDMWSLRGVDCSGLLFEATNGYTPRNTSQLFYFGKSLEIKDCSLKKIASLVRPLDLIIYKGHVVIIMNSEFTIESQENKGVIITPLIKRLEKIYQTKKPQNNLIHEKISQEVFLVNRWIN